MQEKEKELLTFQDLENATKTSPLDTQTMAIMVVILHLQYVRWSYSREKLFINDPRYNKALLILIEKFGIETFTLALKRTFDFNLENLDIRNLEFGPHSDIAPYGMEGQRFAEKMIDHCHLIPNTRDSGYLVNVKTSFGDVGLWNFLLEANDATRQCYRDMISHIKNWPAELKNSSMYNPQKKFNPIAFFAEYFPDAFCLVEKDLFFSNSPESKTNWQHTDLVSLSPGTYQIIRSNYLYTWSLGTITKNAVQEYLLAQPLLLSEKPALHNLPIAQVEENVFKTLIFQHIQQRPRLQEWLKDYSFEWEQFCVANNSSRKSSNQLTGVEQLCSKVFGVKPKASFRKDTSSGFNFVLENSRRAYKPPIDVSFNPDEIDLKKVQCKLKLFAIDFTFDKDSHTIAIYSIENFLKAMQLCLLTGALLPRSENFINFIINSNAEKILTAFVKNSDIELKPYYQLPSNNNEVSNFIDTDEPVLSLSAEQKARTQTTLSMLNALIQNKSLMDLAKKPQQVTEKESVENDYTKKYLLHFIKYLPEICFAYPNQQSAIINWILANKCVQEELRIAQIIGLLKNCPLHQEKLIAHLLSDNVFKNIILHADFDKLVIACPDYKSIFLKKLNAEKDLAKHIFRYFNEALAKSFTEKFDREIVVSQYLNFSDLSYELNNIMKAFPDMLSLIFNYFLNNKDVLRKLLSNPSDIKRFNEFPEEHKNLLFDMIMQDNYLLSLVIQSDKSIKNFLKLIETKAQKIELVCNYILKNKPKVSFDSWSEIIDLLELCLDQKEKMLFWVLENANIIIVDYYLDKLIAEFPSCKEQIFDYLVSHNFLHVYLNKGFEGFYQVEKLIKDFPSRENIILDTVFNDKEILYKVIQNSFFRRPDNMIKAAKYCSDANRKKILLQFIFDKFDLLHYGIECSKEFIAVFEEFENIIVVKILELISKTLPDGWRISSILDAHEKHQAAIVAWLLSDVARFKVIYEIDKLKTHHFNFALYLVFKALKDNQLKQDVLDFVIKHNLFDLILSETDSIESIATHISPGQQDQVISLLLQNEELANKLFKNTDKTQKLCKAYPAHMQLITAYIRKNSALMSQLFPSVKCFVEFFAKNMAIKGFQTFFTEIKDDLLYNEQLMEYFLVKDLIRTYNLYESFLSVMEDEIDTWFEFVVAKPKINQKFFSDASCIEKLLIKFPNIEEKLVDVVLKNSAISGKFFNLNYIDISRNLKPENKIKLLEHVFNDSSLFAKLIVNGVFLESLISYYPSYAEKAIYALLNDDKSSMQMLSGITNLGIFSDLNNAVISETIANKILSLQIDIIKPINNNNNLCYIAQHYPAMQAYMLQLLANHPEKIQFIFNQAQDLKNAHSVFDEKLLLNFLRESGCYLKCAQNLNNLNIIIETLPQLQNELISDQIESGAFKRLLNNGNEAVALLRLVSEENRNKLVKFILADTTLVCRCFQDFAMLSEFIAVAQPSAASIISTIINYPNVLRSCFSNLTNLDSLFEKFSLDPELKKTILRQLLSENQLRLENSKSEESKITLNM